MARTMRRSALDGEKSNSSAACGTLSKPMKAQGAMATIAMIAATGLTPSGSAGDILPKWVVGLAITEMMIAVTAMIISTQAQYWTRPDRAGPRLLRTAEATRAFAARR